jgi:hypothetical protein
MNAETSTRRKPHSNLHKRRRVLARSIAAVGQLPAVKYDAFKRQKRIDVPKTDEHGIPVYLKGKPVLASVAVERWRIQVSPNSERGIILQLKNPNRGARMGKKRVQ